MKRLGRGAVVAVAAAAALVAGLSANVPSSYGAATPTPPYTVMTLQTPPSNQLYTSTTVYEATSGGIVGEDWNEGVKFAAHAVDLVTIIRPKTGGALGVGTFPVTPDPDATHVGFVLSSENGGCVAPGTGTLQIQEVSLDGMGAPTVFSGTYDVNCGGDDVSGEIRFNSTTPYAVAGVTPIEKNLGNADAGSTGPPQAITFTSAGPTPTHFTGPATFGGADADQFVVIDDGCDGQTLDPGESCAVTVAARPDHLGQLLGTLQVPDNSARGAALVSLWANGFRGARGTMYGATSSRILDTRKGLGAPTGAVAGGHVVHLKVTGAHLVPTTGTGAVVVNLTVTGATGGGYITAYPTGTARPKTSSLNYKRGGSRANLAIVEVGTGGQIDLYNCCGHAHLIADIVGWFAADDYVLRTRILGRTLQLAEPQRMLDTRRWKPAGLPSRYITEVAFDYGSTYNSSLTAVLVTLTAVHPRTGGYLTAYMGSGIPTAMSNVNFAAGQTTPNLAIVSTTKCTDAWCKGLPSIWVYNGSGATVNVLVDVIGFFAAGDLPYGMTYEPSTPTRVVDTRVPVGVGPLGPASTSVVSVPDPPAGTYTGAVVANVTAIKPTLPTYLTVWSGFSGTTRPTISSSNPAAGDTVANTTVTGVTVNNSFDVFNHAGTTNAAVDISGTFEYSVLDFTSPGGLRLFTGARGKAPFAVGPATRPSSTAPTPTAASSLRWEP